MKRHSIPTKPLIRSGPSSKKSLMLIPWASSTAVRDNSDFLLTRMIHFVMRNGRDASFLLVDYLFVLTRLSVVQNQIHECSVFLMVAWIVLQSFLKMFKPSDCLLLVDWYIRVTNHEGKGHFVVSSYDKIFLLDFFSMKSVSIIFRILGILITSLTVFTCTLKEA